MEVKLLLKELVQQTVQQALLQDLTWWENLLRCCASRNRDNPERRRFKSLRVNGIVSIMLSV